MQRAAGVTFELDAGAPGRLGVPLVDPHRFSAAASACALEIERKLTSWSRWPRLEPALARLSVAALVAHVLKPYGPGSAADLDAMLAAPTLDCSNYGLLTCHVARSIADAPHAVASVRFVGWESAAIGNHQMLFAESGTEGGPCLLLDPTLGVVAAAGFDDVASGRGVPAADVVIFRHQSILEAVRSRFVEALVAGALRPSELLYYFESEEHLLSRFGSPLHWPTPGAMLWRQFDSGQRKR